MNALQHFNQAVHNRELAWTPDKSRFSDWYVTTSFYAALHLVASYFAHDGVRAGNHEEREAALLSDLHLRPIAPAYLRLFNDCMGARYHGYRFGAAELSAVDADLAAVAALPGQFVPVVARW